MGYTREAKRRGRTRSEGCIESCCCHDKSLGVWKKAGGHSSVSQCTGAALLLASLLDMADGSGLFDFLADFSFA